MRLPTLAVLERETEFFLNYINNLVFLSAVQLSATFVIFFNNISCSVLAWLCFCLSLFPAILHLPTYSVISLGWLNINSKQPVQKPQCSTHYPALLQIQSNTPCHSHYCFYWPHHCVFAPYRYTLGNIAGRRLEHFSLIHSSGKYLHVFCSLTKGKYHLSKSFLQLMVPIPTHWNLSLKYSTGS